MKKRKNPDKPKPLLYYVALNFISLNNQTSLKTISESGRGNKVEDTIMSPPQKKVTGTA